MIVLVLIAMLYPLADIASVVNGIVLSPLAKKTLDGVLADLALGNLFTDCRHYCRCCPSPRYALNLHPFLLFFFSCNKVKVELGY